MTRCRKQKMMRVRQRGTGEGAIAMAGKDGTLWVQFNRLGHHHSGGWHLYPRHHFHRRK